MTVQPATVTAATDGTARRSGDLHVEVVRDVQTLETHAAAWQALADNAIEPNVFLEPWCLLPALRHLDLGGPLRAALVHHRAAGRDRLVGVFPFVRRARWHGFPLPHLAMVKHPHLFLSTPLVSPECPEAIWGAILNWSKSQNVLAIDLGYCHADGPVARGLDRAACAHRTVHHVLDRFDRAVLHRHPQGGEAALRDAASAKSRKSWRRLRRRLAEAGAIETRALGAAERAEPWIEEILSMEARGWKGRARSAMASDASEARFFREIALRGHGRGALHMLGMFLDRAKPVALQCNLFAGGCGFAFKVAYDEAYGAFSPGALLEVDAVLDFHDRVNFEWIDSCTGPNHLLTRRLWPNRLMLSRRIVAVPGCSGRVAVGMVARAGPVHARLRNALQLARRYPSKWKRT